MEILSWELTNKVLETWTLYIRNKNNFTTDFGNITKQSDNCWLIRSNYLISERKKESKQDAMKFLLSILEANRIKNILIEVEDIDKTNVILRISIIQLLDSFILEIFSIQNIFIPKLAKNKDLLNKRIVLNKNNRLALPLSNDDIKNLGLLKTVENKIKYMGFKLL